MISSLEGIVKISISAVEFPGKGSSFNPYFEFGLGTKLHRTKHSSGAKPDFSETITMVYNSESLLFYKVLEKKVIRKDKTIDEDQIDLTILKSAFKQENTLNIKQGDKIRGKFKLSLLLFPYKLSPHDIFRELTSEVHVHTNPAANEEIYHAVLETTRQKVYVSLLSFAGKQKLFEYKKKLEGYSAIRSPNICVLLHVLDKVTESTTHLLVISELKAGDMLFKVISNRKAVKEYWEEKALMLVFLEIVRLFLEFYQCGAHHGDICPLCLQISPQVRVCSIGVAMKPLEVYLLDAHLKAQEMRIPYFSPIMYENYELAQQKKPLIAHDPFKSDVFSLGLVFYHMASLKAPLGLNDMHVSLESRISSCVADIPYGESIKGLLSKMLSVPEETRSPLLQIHNDLVTSLGIQ